MIYIPNTDHIFTEKEAKKWLKQHVIVQRKDLRRISALAKKLGFYKELKALGVTMQELDYEGSRRR